MAAKKKVAKFVPVTEDPTVFQVPTAQIFPDPDQPRKEFDAAELKSLAESIEKMGLLMPVRVRPGDQPDTYILIAGERRWRACQMAKIAMMSAKVRMEPATASELLEEQLVENALRSDLSPIESAKAYKKLIDLNGWSYAVLGAKLFVDKATISRTLKLLELPEGTQKLVEDGELPAVTAYELSKIKNPEALAEATQAAVEGKKSRKQVRDEIVAQDPTVARPPKPGLVAPVNIYMDNGVTVKVTRKSEGPETIVDILTKALAIAKKEAKTKADPA